MEGIPQRVSMGGTLRSYSSTLGDERAKAIEALKRMKEIERKRMRKLRAVRIDERTVTYSSGQRLEEICAHHGVGMPRRRRKRSK